MSANSQVLLGCQTSYRFLKPRIPSYLSQHQSFFLFFLFFLQQGIARWNWVRGIGPHSSFSDHSLRVILLCLGFPWESSSLLQICYLLFFTVLRDFPPPAESHISIKKEKQDQNGVIYPQTANQDITKVSTSPRNVPINSL